MNKNLKRLILALLFIWACLNISQKAEAVTLDLSALNASVGPTETIGSDTYYLHSIFSRTAALGSGSGALDPFVRMHKEGNSTTERGYNTDAPGNPIQAGYDMLTDPKTHSLRLSDVPIVNVNGTDYREFILDCAEPGAAAKSTLYLDTLKFYLVDESVGGSLSNYPTGFGSHVYSLDDRGADFSILLDNLSSGQGSIDMFAYIENSYFGFGNQYLYLYSEFSQCDGSFDEWAVKEGIIPEPTSLLLLGLGGWGLMGLKKG